MSSCFYFFIFMSQMRPHLLLPVLAIILKGNMNAPAEDANLIERIRCGNSAAYVELVRRYERTARVVAMRYLQNHHSVEHAVQQAFLIGFEKLASLHEPKSFGAWILRIVQREAQALGRSQSRLVTLPDSIQPESPPLTIDSSFQQLAELLNELPEHERTVVTLHYLDGHSTRAVAAMLSRPIGTVTKQLSRAIDRLKHLSRQSEDCHEP